MPVWYNETLDDQPVFDLTGDFRGGMNATMAPSLLPNNQYSYGENVMLTNAGGLRSRYGTSQLASASSPSFLFYFDTPTHEKLMMVRDNTFSYYDGSTTSTVSGFSETGGMALMQGMDMFFTATSGGLYEFDGTNLYKTKQLKVTIDSGGSGYSSASVTVSGGGSPVEDATVAATVADGAVSVLNITNQGRGYTSTPTLTITGDGSSATATAELVDPPSGTIGVWHTNRMFLAGLTGEQSDTIRVSDLLDQTNWPAANSFRVGGGEGESIIALKSWDVMNMLVWKESSTYLVQTDPVQSVANWPIQKVSDNIGCVSSRTAVQVGADVWWLSKQGVVSVRRMQQETQREVSAAISVPIQDYIDRINWNAANTACATFYDNKYMLAVPLDGEASPTHILVYDTLHQCWAGVWTGLGCKDLTPTNFSSVKGLAFSSSDGDVLEYDATKTADTIQGTATAYSSKIYLRGYSFGEVVTQKTALNTEVEFYRSSATDVTFSVTLDEADPIIVASNIASGAALTTLPFEEEAGIVLAALGTTQKSYNIMGYPQFRSLQPRLEANTGVLSLRTLKASAFLDTIDLHTG